MLFPARFYRIYFLAFYFYQNILQVFTNVLIQLGNIFNIFIKGQFIVQKKKNNNNVFLELKNGLNVYKTRIIQADCE
jgi:hypothetical protein